MWNGLVIGLTGFDLLVKHRVETTMKEGGREKELGPVFVLRKVHNHGLLLGKGSKHKKLVALLSFGAGILLLLSWVFRKKKEGWLEQLGGSLMVAGCLSNLYDRGSRGYVVDYLSWKNKDGKGVDLTLNGADIFLILGYLLRGIAGIRRERKTALKEETLK